MDPVLENEFLRLKKEIVRLEGVIARGKRNDIKDQFGKRIDKALKDFIFFYQNFGPKIDVQDFEKVKKFYKDGDVISSLREVEKVMQNIENEANIDSSNILNT